MVIEARALEFRFTAGVEVSVLRGVDLVVQPGEMVSLMGDSGSGKTTLLSILGLLQRPTGGRYSFLGQGVESLSEAKMAVMRNLSIGFVFQHHLLLPELAAWENVALNAVIAGQRSWSKARERALKLLEVLGLAERATHFPRQLSGGEQQRVAIARALVNNPDLILADEPTGNLDSDNSRRTLGIFRALHSKGQHTLIIATHNPAIAQMCPRQLVIRDGVIAQDVRTATPATPPAARAEAAR
jgi:putative ABC transport system ATP-binding protein